LKTRIYRALARSAVCGMLVLLAVSFTALSRAAAQRPPLADFAAIDNYVQSEMQAMRLPGLALGIVQGDQIAHLRGFGTADPSGRAVTPQTPFITASLSKSFTALAIMQLVESGKVDLDAPVQRYLPWFQVADPVASTRITVRHLLNQTSGLPEAAGLTYIYSSDTRDSALEQAVRAAHTVELTYPPGQTAQYCNLNYSILGLIVQTVSGETYEQYMQQHILAPLKMNNSFGSPDDAQRHGLATGYQFWFGRPAATRFIYNRANVPAGYISSSAEDMAHYLIAQLNDGRYEHEPILSAAGVAELHRPAIPLNGANQFYGLGWKIEDDNGVRTVGHSGDLLDVHADMILAPESHWGIVVLVNGNDQLQLGRLQALAPGVLSMLMKHKPAPIPRYDAEPLALLLVASAACALQVLGIARALVSLWRQRTQPARRERGVADVGRRVVLPLALNLLWALICLVVVPRLLATPLWLLVRVDVGLVIVASGAIALVWGVLRAILVLDVLHTVRRRDEHYRVSFT